MAKPKKALKLTTVKTEEHYTITKEYVNKSAESGISIVSIILIIEHGRSCYSIEQGEDEAYFEFGGMSKFSIDHNVAMVECISEALSIVNKELKFNSKSDTTDSDVNV